MKPLSKLFTHYPLDYGSPELGNLHLSASHGPSSHSSTSTGLTVLQAGSATKYIHANINVVVCSK